jgi:hypothetical protein
MDSSANSFNLYSTEESKLAITPLLEGKKRRLLIFYSLLLLVCLILISLIVIWIISTKSSAAENPRNNEFRAPGPRDVRSPCPALNALANHGYLPRSGQGLSNQTIISAFKLVFNVKDDIPTRIFNRAAEMIGGLGDNGEIIVSLEDLREHGVIEHDASLTRFDFGDPGKDNYMQQKSLVEQMKGFARNSSLDYTGIIQAMALRIKQENSSDSDFTYGESERRRGLNEAAFTIRLFGNGKSIPIDWIDSWFMDERIPDGWTRPTTPYDIAESGLLVSKLDNCLKMVDQQGFSCNI